MKTVMKNLQQLLMNITIVEKTRKNTKFNVFGYRSMELYFHYMSNKIT